MPRYLIQATYSTDGAKGLLKEGGRNRRRAVEGMLASLGGKLEAYYFGLGESDVYSIVELPDNVSAVALAVAVNATGAVRLQTTVLLTPDEMDAATKIAVDYRPPEGRFPFP